MLEEELIEIDIDSEDTDLTLPSPRLELDGVLSDQELIYIKSLTEKKEKDCLPLFIIYGTERIPCGTLGLNLDNILQLKYIGISKYFLYLVTEEESLAILNPKDEKNEILKMLNFIKIRK